MNNLGSIFLASLFNTILDSVVNGDKYEEKDKEEIVEELNKKLDTKKDTKLHNFDDTEAYIDIVNAVATDAPEGVKDLYRRLTTFYTVIDDIHNRLKKLEAKN